MTPIRAGASNGRGGSRHRRARWGWWLATALGLGGVLWQWRAAVQARNVADQESRNAKDQANLAEQRRNEAEARRLEAEQARAKERQTELAKEQTELAKQRLQDTLKARAEEKKQTKLAEQRLYDVRMNFVQRYWEDYDGKHSNKGSPISFHPIRAASTAEVSNGFTGNEGCPRGTSPSRGTLAGSRAWRSARTARGSPPLICWGW